MELYEALKNGTSKEDLIKAFTEELNAATAKLEENKAAELKKQKKDKELEEARNNAISALEAYYKLLGIDAHIDFSNNLGSSVNTMLKEFGKLFGWEPKNSLKDDDDDILSKFIMTL